jgi:hypothetical protein
MSVTRSGVRLHDDALSAAEGARQVAVAAASTQAAVRSAEITFFRAYLLSCRTNNGGSGIEPPLTALRELGVGQ